MQKRHAVVFRQPCDAAHGLLSLLRVVFRRPVPFHSCHPLEQKHSLSFRFFFLLHHHQQLPFLQCHQVVHRGDRVLRASLPPPGLYGGVRDPGQRGRYLYTPLLPVVLVRALHFSQQQQALCFFFLNNTSVRSGACLFFSCSFFLPGPVLLELPVVVPLFSVFPFFGPPALGPFLPGG
jgi:hypothetical protein